MKVPFKNIKSLFYLVVFGVCSVVLTNCSTKNDPTLFQKLDSDQTGITFENNIVTDDSTNALLDPYIFNGGGVGIGDLNNDGLQDVILTGTMASPTVYLNQGDFSFKDITETAGLNTDKRIHGVTLIDINSDELLDIYFSASGPVWSDENDRRNLLYINNGDTTFTEQASAWRIDDPGFTTHSAFLDYDQDGDLDLFLLNNSPEEFSRSETGLIPMGGQDEAFNRSGLDRFYRNNGDGSFSDVSAEAGMLRKLGYGLGVAVSDLNGDNWPDIYVSNDMTPNDVLYINNQDGSFSDKAAEWLRHTSHSGMGVDMADYTNNGWPDILQSDMMPDDLTIRKRVSGANTYSGYTESLRQGLFPHFNMNTLQMNLGISESGDVIFSEVARMAGVAYTHWSWASLLVDLDNDGWKDAFITNGFPIAGTDYDHLARINRAQQSSDPNEAIRKQVEIFENVRPFDVPNYLFRNEGDGTFSDVSDDWGMSEPGFAYGAAYADLDNDGRLDLIVSNINAPASVYRNTAPRGEQGPHYLTVQLDGQAPNTNGIGATVWIWAGGQQQMLEQYPARGFMSSVDLRLHAGLGGAAVIDSLRIDWPDGRSQTLRHVQADQRLTLRQAEAFPAAPFRPASGSSGHMFEELSAEQSLSHLDSPSETVDYSVQPLLPYMISRQGPPLAAGDVNGDGLEDLFIGGDAGSSGTLYLQQSDGTFSEYTQSRPWQADSDQADWGASFVDVNGDGLLDLYVASGSYHSSPVSLLLQDRIYLNYGNGRFLKEETLLPEMLTSTAAIAPGDFNGDGQVDLFVGGRLSPRNWPAPTRSWLLHNDGDRFTDVTAHMLPELTDPGSMITDAVWADVTGDGTDELITAGQWQPIQVYQVRENEFTNITESLNLPALRGWWESLAAADLNGDGKDDIIAGNLGLNHTYTTSPESPFGVVAADLTGNRTTDIILTKEVNGTETPLYGLAKLGREIYTVGIAFDSFESFSNASVGQVVGSETLGEALRYQADTFASMVLLSRPDGTYNTGTLPPLAQIAPIEDIEVADIDGDGHTDLIIGGNRYESEPTAPRADAGNGLLLKGDGNGGFTTVPPMESGLLAPGDVRDLQLLNSPNGRTLIISNNADSTKVFRINSN